MTIPHLHNLPKMIQLESIRTLISSQVYKTCAFFTKISLFFLNIWIFKFTNCHFILFWINKSFSALKTICFTSGFSLKKKKKKEREGAKLKGKRKEKFCCVFPLNNRARTIFLTHAYEITKATGMRLEKETACRAFLLQQGLNHSGREKEMQPYQHLDFGLERPMAGF